MDSSFVSILSIGAMLIGVIFALGSPESSGQYRRALSVFALGAAIFLAQYLTENPAALSNAQAQIAVALIGLIIFFIRSLQRQKK